MGEAAPALALTLAARDGRPSCPRFTSPQLRRSPRGHTTDQFSAVSLPVPNVVVVVVVVVFVLVVVVVPGRTTGPWTSHTEIISLAAAMTFGPRVASLPRVPA